MSIEQADLFGNIPGASNAYGAPMFHANDPKSSREAARKHTASGNRSRNADIVLSLVMENPNSTANELWEFSNDLQKKQLVDYYEIRRRLNDLHEAKKVRVTGNRACSIKGTTMQIWDAT